MELQIGTVVGDYQIVGILGAGGMGSVYQVKNLISDRLEAMKVLLPDLSGNPELAERFQREIKVLGSLDHPNIAQLRTAFRAGNQLLMVMEFIDGVTLEQVFKDGPLRVPQAIDAISQVLSALEFAHAHGVIHRDIKPANMIMTKTGVVKLMDFGIAKAAADYKLTSTGATMGSLYYMSPEQIQGLATLDARTDLYSVGVTLYQLVTGKRPFDGDSMHAIMAAHLEKIPIPPISIDPRLPQALNDVILMSVAKSPDGRFQTAAAFRNALASVGSTIQPSQPAARAPFATVAGGSVAPSAASTIPLAAPMHPQVLASPSRSNRGLWMALGGIAAAAAIVAVIEFGPWKGVHANSSRTPAAVVQQSPPASQQPAQPVVQADVAPPPPDQAASSAPQPGSAPPQPTMAANASTPAPTSQSPARQAPGGNQVAYAKPAQPPPASNPAPQPVQPAPQPAPQQAQQTPAPPPAPAGPSREELMHARERSAKLNVRVSAVRDGLLNLKRSMQSKGMGLSARFTQPEGLMNTYLQAAGDALNAGDLPAFRDYSDKAERQVEILEKLLNL